MAKLAFAFQHTFHSIQIADLSPFTFQTSHLRNFSPNSITLGGFGMDRFYLGNWQEAFGKLFSFGGLGFWTLIDVILIWVGYLKPADGNYS